MQWDPLILIGFGLAVASQAGFFVGLPGQALAAGLWLWTVLHFPS